MGPSDHIRKHISPFSRLYGAARDKFLCIVRSALDNHPFNTGSEENVLLHIYFHFSTICMIEASLIDF